MKLGGAAMQWLQISIDILNGQMDAVASALTAAGFSDLVMEDQQEFEEFLDDNRAYWDYIDEQLQQKLEGLSRIQLYLEDTDTAGLSRLQTLVENLNGKHKYGQLTLTVEPMAETNWEESWKDNYPPQEVGKNLIVVPVWRSEETNGRLPVILDPGLTFGTGAHPSTQMVMETMEETIRPDSCCLDLGSGSGILSIAALRLGAKSAVGVDIDPKAEDIARENAAFNGFGAPEFTALTGNVTEDTALMDTLRSRRYDLVLVNIVADVIIALSPVLPKFLDNDSVLILSGILDTRLDDVLQALEKAGLEPVRIRAKEDWRCVCAKRRIV